MTEEIIIDGCNVKDCRRRIGKNNYCRYYKRPCADNNYNCIWKKCLRLEQENRQMKSALEEIRNIAEELCEQKNCEEDTHRYSCHYEDVKNILTKINEVLQ